MRLMPRKVNTFVFYMLHWQVTIHLLTIHLPPTRTHIILTAKSHLGARRIFSLSCVSFAWRVR
jgi:hypothetical protein